MTDPDRVVQTQLANIVKRTGRSIEQLHAFLRASGLQKHGEMVTHLKHELHMGHGDANTVVHLFRASITDSASTAPADPLDAIYTGAKATLRPLHAAVMAALAGLGPFEEAPKKAYVSLRRKKQFAMVGPGSKGRLEVGINLRDGVATERLVAMPAGGMCSFKVWLTTPDEVDEELLGWIRAAYDAAG